MTTLLFSSLISSLINAQARAQANRELGGLNQRLGTCEGISWQLPAQKYQRKQMKQPLSGKICETFTEICKRNKNRQKETQEFYQYYYF